MLLHSVMLLNITTDVPRVEYYEIFQMLCKQNKGIHHGVIFCLAGAFLSVLGSFMTKARVSI